MDLEKLTDEILFSPFSPEPYFNRGAEYYRLGKFNEAIEDFIKATELNPGYAEAYYNLGLCYSKGIQDFQKGLDYYNIAIELKSDFYDAYIYRGNTFMKMKKYDEAIMDYSKAIELDSTKPIAYLNRGYTFMKGYELYSQAIKDFTAALEIKPDFKEAYINRGAAYADGYKEFEKSIQDFNKVLEMDPNYADAYFSLGATYLKMQDVENTSKNWEKAYELGHKDVKKLLESLYKKINK